MSTTKKSLSIVLLWASFGAIPVVAADIKAGEEKSEACVGCHGQGGVSAASQFPILAAQQPDYLVIQLKAFKSGARKNPLMEGIAARLSDDDMADLAAYFSRRPAAKAGGDQALAQIGREKAAICLGCHGPMATGNGQIPRLAGQHPEYQVNQLKNFKAGDRESGHMQAIAGTLSEDDMKALAAYFGSL
ncbi:MAG: c-type cytochrome [Gammaproteobacteria bacterium]